eukprot:m.367899 g.367899  ORF g.367899 m.367899 type:complete len:58 (-) comp42802_c0_seq1:76-249(-)
MCHVFLLFHRSHIGLFLFCCIAFAHVFGCLFLSFLLFYLHLMHLILNSVEFLFFVLF